MEDSSLSESEAENKGTSGGKEPLRVAAAASSAGFSPNSEVHIVLHSSTSSLSPPLLSSLSLALLHSFFLSLFFALRPWDPFKNAPLLPLPPTTPHLLLVLLLPPLLSSLLSLIRQTRASVPLFVSLFLRSPPQFSRSSLSLPISD